MVPRAGRSAGGGRGIAGGKRFVERLVEIALDLLRLPLGVLVRVAEGRCHDLRSAWLRRARSAIIGVPGARKCGCAAFRLRGKKISYRGRRKIHAKGRHPIGRA